MDKKGKREAGIINNFPKFCDFSCSFASFAPSDSVGACRKEISIWCKKLKKYNYKHHRCLYKGE